MIALQSLQDFERVVLAAVRELRSSDEPCSLLQIVEALRLKLDMFRYEKVEKAHGYILEALLKLQREGYIDVTLTIQLPDG